MCKRRASTFGSSCRLRWGGIDSDNDSEFINNHLRRYRTTQQIQFTRGRPYKEDDNAHIEQKNWTYMRRLLDYLRYDSPAALTAINRLRPSVDVQIRPLMDS